MWLSSHPNCPICRAPAACDGTTTTSSTADSFDDQLGLIGDGDSALEVVVDIPSFELESDQNAVAVAVAGDSVPVSPSSSSLGCSLKRMLSRNRSERKIFPSSNANEVIRDDCA